MYQPTLSLQYQRPVQHREVLQREALGSYLLLLLAPEREQIRQLLAQPMAQRLRAAGAISLRICDDDLRYARNVCCLGSSGLTIRSDDQKCDWRP